MYNVRHVNLPKTIRHVKKTNKMLWSFLKLFIYHYVFLITLFYLSSLIFIM